MGSGEMEMALDQVQEQPPLEALAFARSYQLEAMEKAIKQNTIVFLETGSGKTLIAIMLLRHYAYLLRKPSPFIAVFLVPTVVLVTQQAEAVMMHTDLKVGKFWGEMGVDFWKADDWEEQQDQFEVLVMTPQILLDALRHSFFKLDMIKLLIFDECHNARGRHPYACIMTEFYHRQLKCADNQLPRIFGMTASPVKTKVSSSGSSYWDQINELETLMNAKVYTCESEAVLAKYIPFSTPKLVIYEHKDIPYTLAECISNKLSALTEQCKFSLKESEKLESAMESAVRRVTTLYSAYLFCLNELGVWLAMKAAESLSRSGAEIFLWEKLDICGETAVRDFNTHAYKIFSDYVPSQWHIGGDIIANVKAGYLTNKVICLLESLLAYRHMNDLRCIIFVERVITALVLQTLLSELLPKITGWKTEYTAGHSCGLAQSRSIQNKIVNDFRKGEVNIIVATSILEEGLDVQSCNLVIRFDPSSTVCSFIQSRGRARMQNSEFLLMVKSDDMSTLKKVTNYLKCGEVMRKESLEHASLPCEALDHDLVNEICYRVDSTGAIVTLSSSISLIYFYCSRLPSDGYFKSYPRCVIEKELNTCTITFPKNCPLPSVTVSGDAKMLKQLACLEACQKLHLLGALTDNLVPDIVIEEAVAHEIGSSSHVEEQAKYSPPELISQSNDCSIKQYHIYFIQLQRNFNYDVPLNNILLAVRSKLEIDDDEFNFDLEADRGNITVCVRHVGVVSLTYDQVLFAQKFQVTLFQVLLDHSLAKYKEGYDPSMKKDCALFDYLLLPTSVRHQEPITIDWYSIRAALFPSENTKIEEFNCSLEVKGHWVHTQNGEVCRCMAERSLIYTPHNGHIYCITGSLHNLNGNSLLNLKGGGVMTYKSYFEKRHGVHLQYEGESLLQGRRIFPVQNCLQRCRLQKDKEQSHFSVELPPELCHIIMSPISISTLYSFSFVPSIVHRIESLLIAANLKKMQLDHCIENVNISTVKVLEAITTKKCQEKFHLESLETLGDSFLKYAASQQLFKVHQKQHEGILSAKRERIIANATLCNLGCDRNIVGFIRDEIFDPKTWIIPAESSIQYPLNETMVSATRKVYSGRPRKIKSKTVADVVEALIGAFLSNGGERAALLFMDWLGIQVDFIVTPYERNFPVKAEMLLNVRHLESILNYTFHDSTLLVEALTHGSYMLPEIPGCYQRLEFLGDAVLDYLITVHLYNIYPGMSPGMLTDLRSASVNNDCYALSAIKAGLHKHVLHSSLELHRHIVAAVHELNQSSSTLLSTFGWESEISIPKVLGDIIESLAGAILVDSGYNKEIVFQSIRPLLEPLITPEMMRHHPVKELNELCQKANYDKKKPIISKVNGQTIITIEVEANGVIFKGSGSAADKKTAKKLASKDVLKSLKETKIA